MQRLFKKLLFSFVLLSIGVASVAQPSFSVYLSFRLYTPQGESIDYTRFCQDFRLLGEGGREDQTPCTNEHIAQQYFYDDSSMMYRVPGTIVYNDLERLFIYGSDSMQIILATYGGGNRSIQIDSLVFKPGGYYLTDTYYHHIDFQQAALDYYNYILEWATLTRKQLANYQEAPVYAILTRLRRKYGFPLDDWEKKTLADLFGE